VEKKSKTEIIWLWLQRKEDNSKSVKEIIVFDIVQ